TGSRGPGGTPGSSAAVLGAENPTSAVVRSAPRPAARERLRRCVMPPIFGDRAGRGGQNRRNGASAGAWAAQRPGVEPAVPTDGGGPAAAYAELVLPRPERRVHVAVDEDP